MTDGRSTEFSFEIKEHLGVITTNSSGWRRELNIVSWNNTEPKFDIRDWNESHEHMSKGITLRREELEIVIALAQQYGVKPEIADNPCIEEKKVKGAQTSKLTSKDAEAREESAAT